MTELLFPELVHQQFFRKIFSSKDKESIRVAGILADYLRLDADCFIMKNSEVSVFVTSGGIYPAVLVSNGFNYLYVDPAEDTETISYISKEAASFALTVYIAQLLMREFLMDASNPSFHVCYPSEIKLNAMKHLSGEELHEFNEYVSYLEMCSF